MATCKRCKAPIRFVKTENNRHMPIDVHKVDGGNIVVDEDANLARVVKPVKGVYRYRSHFASCPAADEMRKR